MWILNNKIRFLIFFLWEASKYYVFGTNFIGLKDPTTSICVLENSCTKSLNLIKKFFFVTLDDKALKEKKLFFSFFIF